MLKPAVYRARLPAFLTFTVCRQDSTLCKALSRSWHSKSKKINVIFYDYEDGKHVVCTKRNTLVTDLLVYDAVCA